MAFGVVMQHNLCSSRNKIFSDDYDQIEDYDDYDFQSIDYDE